MSNQFVQDEVVSIAEIDDEDARWDLALRAHPFYADAPQVHLQAIIHYNAAVPMAAVFLSALSFYTGFPYIWILSDVNEAVPRVVLTLVAAFFCSFTSVALAMAPRIWIPISVGTWSVWVFEEIGFGLATHYYLYTTVACWGVAAMIVLWMAKENILSVEIPPEIGLGAWDQFKDEFRKRKKILRGVHKVRFGAMAIIAAAPFHMSYALLFVLPVWAVVLIATFFSAYLARLTIQSTGEDPDLVLFCASIGYEAPTLAAYICGQTLLIAALSGLTLLVTAFLIPTFWG